MESNDENDTAGTERSFFVEKEEVLRLIIFLLCHDDKNLKEIAELDKLKKILDAYQEQPQLLGPHIEEMVLPLNTWLTQMIEQNVSDIQWEKFHLVCKIYYHITKVRGFKRISKYFPHEVYQLEPCLAVLHIQDNANHQIWEIRYVLLLWLSNLVLIPFDLNSMDSSIESINENKKKSKLVEELIDVCTSFLKDTGPVREAASVCIANLVTRPDMNMYHLGNFIQKSKKLLEDMVLEENNNQNYFLRIGILYTFSQVFKRGHREKLIVLCPALLALVLQLSDRTTQKLERKLCCKLLQRLSITLLPPKEATWKYKRGQRSLAISSLTVISEAEHSEMEEHTSDAFDDVMISSDIEEVIDRMLQFLSDKDTVVRWSAAKGIGRITMRLTKALGSDIVDAITGLFDEEDSDLHWHGGCLALAELTRRGLLLPDKLDFVIPLISKAMHFDLLKGQHGIGAHVRDAASYVCWSLARAYDSWIMKPYVDQLTTTMLLSILYDREINCRKAASAAFQENVGRQGHSNFPNGIEIITIADYFSVGNRNLSYLTLAPSIASLNFGYFKSFVDNLVSVKIGHWDDEIRILSGKALYKLLSSQNDAGVLLETLNLLLDKVKSNTLFERHGGLLALSWVIFVVAQQLGAIPQEPLVRLEEFIQSIEKNRIFKGRGGEIIREAVCRLFEQIAKSNIDVSLKTQVVMVEIINEQIRQPHDKIQLAGRDALRQVLFVYFGEKNLSAPSEKLLKLTVQKYINGLSTEDNVAATRGYALAIGALPKRLLFAGEELFNDIWKALERFTDPKHKICGEYDAETCKYSIESMIEICEKCVSLQHFASDYLWKCFDVLIRSCGDYNIDKRGDTGSWSRVASLKGLERLIKCIMHCFSNKDGKEIMTSFGVAEIGNTFNIGDLVVVETIFLNSSLGFIHSQNDAWLKPQNSIVIYKAAHFDLFQTNSIVIKHRDPLVTALSGYIKKSAAAILKQLSEKLDSVRDIAGSVLSNIIKYLGEETKLAEFHEIRLAIQYDEVLNGLNQVLIDFDSITFNWNNPDQSFSLVTRLLSIPEFTYPIFSGIVVSVGGLTEQTAKSSFIWLCKYLRDQTEENKLIAILNCIAKTMNEEKKNDRVILPTLKSFELLLKESTFDKLSAETKSTFCIQILEVIRLELFQSTNIAKICTGIEVFGLLISWKDHTDEKLSIISKLVSYLYHRYPKVRKCAAEAIYIALLTYFDQCDIYDINLASELVVSVEWDKDDKPYLLENKMKIAEIFGFSELAVGSNKSDKKVKSKADELDSYESLVREAGY